LRENNRVVGLKAAGEGGVKEIYADLVVAADGRSSRIRSLAGLEVQSLGAPIDVLWFRISRLPTDDPQTLGRVLAGQIMVMLNRGEYWQCAFIIPKGEFATLQGKGLDAFRREIVKLAPFVENRVTEIKDWSEVKLLTVMVDRLTQWYQAGLLCIGDAAHAMSPVGGVGINLAIQDAVAAANILTESLLKGTTSISDLKAVQDRRILPTKLTQRAQVFMQERVINRVLGSRKVQTPWFLRLFKVWPFLRRIPARLVGIGVRPEHVRTTDAFTHDPTR